MDPSLFYIAPLFLVIAVVYALTGQGGASAYLAILALFGLPYQELPPIALSCNIVAATGIAYHFYRAGHFKWRLVLPFVITSIPAAFIGGIIPINELTFKILLICTLAVVSVRLFFWEEDAERISIPSVKKAFIVGPLIGAGLGLLAGLIGIGGGIFLMPLIIFLRWGNAKEAAVAGGLFTLANSISGVIGHSTKGGMNWQFIIPLALVVLAGSHIGAHLGAKKVSAAAVQKIFAVLLFGVAARLVIGLF